MIHSVVAGAGHRLTWPVVVEVPEEVTMHRPLAGSLLGHRRLHPALLRR